MSEQQPEEEPRAEEYHPDEDAVSDSTGTAYAPTGEPDATPQDELPEDEDE